MIESDTYQEILEEGVAQGVAQGVERGREQEARSLILQSGTRKLGPPAASIQAQLQSITDVLTLEAIMDRLVDGKIASWTDLVAPLA